MSDPVTLHFFCAIVLLIPSAISRHSHSIVPGGLLVTSWTTRLMPRTSLIMPSVEVTARKAQSFCRFRVEALDEELADELDALLGPTEEMASRTMVEI
jgi:hypothetical protein